ncbi:MAG TPA: hypothetical protein VM186_07980, partial [Planctomycetota bacterium]|nr:hypothetical protein [Planctomycetota bacterium]
TLKVWELATGREVRTLEGHSSGVYAVAVTADGRCAVSGSEDKMLKVWELATGALVASFTGDHEFECCAVAPDGCVIVAGDEFGHVHFLCIENI